jgi:hypothetical protein
LGPWWFCNVEHHIAEGEEGGSSCRFDLRSPDGTCYLSLRPEIALLERASRDQYDYPFVIEVAFLLNEVELHELMVPEQKSLANCVDTEAIGFGIDMSMFASPPPHHSPQAWAAMFHQVGFQGLWYLPRTNPAGSDLCVALFDAEGEREEWGSGRPSPVTDDLIDFLVDSCSIPVVHPPTAAELSIIQANGTI